MACSGGPRNCLFILPSFPCYRAFLLSFFCMLPLLCLCLFLACTHAFASLLRPKAFHTDLATPLLQDTRFTILARLKLKKRKCSRKQRQQQPPERALPYNSNSHTRVACAHGFRHSLSLDKRCARPLCSPHTTFAQPALPNLHGRGTQPYHPPRNSRSTPQGPSLLHRRRKKGSLNQPGRVDPLQQLLPHMRPRCALSPLPALLLQPLVQSAIGSVAPLPLQHPLQRLVGQDCQQGGSMVVHHGGLQRSKAWVLHLKGARNEGEGDSVAGHDSSLQGYQTMAGGWRDMKRGKKAQARHAA